MLIFLISGFALISMRNFHKHLSLFLAASTAAGTLVLVVMLFVSTSFIMPKTAEATPGMGVFGGRIFALVPLLPVPPCPMHTLIFDYVTMYPMGIYVVPSSIVYDYKDLFTPGGHVLGEYVPVPFPTCSALGYPVYPIYQVGTSLGP